VCAVVVGGVGVYVDVGRAAVVCGGVDVVAVVLVDVC